MRKKSLFLSAIFILLGPVMLGLGAGCKSNGVPAAPVPAPTPTATPDPATGRDWYVTALNAGFSARVGLASLVYNPSTGSGQDGTLWVIAGAGSLIMNDVWYSSDAVSWAQATASAAFSTRYNHTSVVYDGKMWVIGGNNPGAGGPKNDVWYSSDGAAWTQATAAAAFSARYQHTSVVYDPSTGSGLSGRMWVIGGSGKNDVYHSTDGVSWIQATAAAAFGAREDHSSVVYAGKMWVIGGYDGGARMNDVWHSTDGVSWTRATDSAAFGARQGHASVVQDGRMWVIGGYDGSVRMNDVWYSSDGVSWTRATASAAFSGRNGHASVVYNPLTGSVLNGLMWVIGGRDEGGYQDDVWHSP